MTRQTQFKNVLVIGGTGAMGRAVIRALTRDAQSSWAATILTRNPGSALARKLVEAGRGRVSAVQGDLNDHESLVAAMRDADAVFANTNFWSSANFRKERTQGIRALRAAHETGVNHFLWSSLDSAASNSSGYLMLPHYDAKASVEHDIDWRRFEEYMLKIEDGWYSKHVSVLVTGPYFENFQSIFRPEHGKLSNGKAGLIFRGPVSGDANWHMIGLDDLGHFVRLMLDDPDSWGGKTLRAGSDELPMRALVAQFSEVTGIPAEWSPPTLDEFESSGVPNAHDVVNNFRLYLEGYASERDYHHLRQLHPGLRTWKSWLEESGWRGEEVLVQKDAITGSAGPEAAETVLVLGATGQVGSAAVDHLLEVDGVSVRGTTRSDSRALDLEAKGIEPRLVDLDDPESIEIAVDGADSLLLVTGYSVELLRQSKRVIDSAQRAGVKRIVHVGASGSSTSEVAHWGWLKMVGAYIEQAGFDYVQLQPEVFMQNLVSFGWFHQGTLANYIGDQVWSWIDAEDVGALAAAALRPHSPLRAETIRMGYQAASMDQVADLIRECVGTAVQLVDADPDQFYETAVAGGADPAYISCVRDQLKLTRDGKLPGTQEVFDGELFERFVGRAPRTLRDYLAGAANELRESPAR